MVGLKVLSTCDVMFYKKKHRVSVWYSRILSECLGSYECKSFQFWHFEIDLDWCSKPIIQSVLARCLFVRFAIITSAKCPIETHTNKSTLFLNLPFVGSWWIISLLFNRWLNNIAISRIFYRIEQGSKHKGPVAFQCVRAFCSNV